jgi:hypothetical protein
MSTIVSVEDQLHAAMIADTTLQGFLGSGATARFYDTQLPQNPVYPCAAYQRISTTRPYVHAAGGSFSNMGKCRVQITIWADPHAARAFDQVRQIAAAFIAALQSFNPYDGRATTGGMTSILNQRGGIEPLTTPPIPRQDLDVQIYFSDATT